MNHNSNYWTSRQRYNVIPSVKKAADVVIERSQNKYTPFYYSVPCRVFYPHGCAQFRAAAQEVFAKSYTNFASSKKTQITWSLMTRFGSLLVSHILKREGPNLLNVLLVYTLLPIHNLIHAEHTHISSLLSMHWMHLPFRALTLTLLYYIDLTWKHRTSEATSSLNYQFCTLLGSRSLKPILTKWVKINPTPDQLIFSTNIFGHFRCNMISLHQKLTLCFDSCFISRTSVPKM